MTPEQEKRFDEFYSPTDASRDGNICITLPSKSAIKDFISSLLKEERERVREEYKEYLQYHYEHFGIESVKALLALTPDTNQTEV